MAREYDNIADAVSAVNGEVAEQSTKIADILEALEGKASGGLPTSISKQCGGSFTFATSTKITEHISHNLGVMPRAVVIWTEESDMGQYCYGGMLIRYESTGATGWRLIFYRSGAQMGANSGSVSDFSNHMGTDFFSLNHGSYSYQAGKTYKWLAWA